jgi:hypothetical protein
MSRSCTVCRHPQRDAMNTAIIVGAPYRRIATHFETSEVAIRRHRAHLPSAMSKAHNAQEVARADSLLDQVRALQAKTLEILRKADGAGICGPRPPRSGRHA